MAYRGCDTLALDDVSMTLGHGELMGLIGPNGAGKTTLISLLATLFPPTEGHVIFKGVDLTRHPKRIRHKIGFVPQNIALYDNLTGRENILYFAQLYGLSKRIAAERARYYLDMFGLSNKGNNRLKTYSGGMKRRINLIVGLIHNPVLLFLDEPTVGIDAQSRNLILEKLSLLNHDGMAMVYTTHYMEEILRICKNVTIIDHGKIICQGGPEQLIKETPNCNDLSELFLARTGKELRDG